MKCVTVNMLTCKLTFCNFASYFIRDVVEDTQWRTANDYLVKDPNYTVHSLLHGHDYEFRVRAKNAAGFSKPSPASQHFKLKGKAKVL